MTERARRPPAAIKAPLRQDPFQLFLALRRDQPRSVFLDSASAPVPAGEGPPRWSYLAAGDFPVVEAKSDAFGALQQAIQGRAPSAPGLPPFQGGFVGMLGYDLARELERLPARARDDLGLPPLWGLVVDEFLALDHVGQTIQAIACPRPGESEKEAELRAFDLMERANAKAPLPQGKLSGQTARSNTGARTYQEMARRAKSHIAAGDVYQVNLAHRLSWDNPSDPLWLYQRLRGLNPSPFAFFLDAGAWQLASCSPERLLRVEGSRVETRPIAGTYPRDADSEAGQALALRSDPKERAEHTMLVDLERNDLGRCSAYGSVQVEEFLATEAYSHVVHLVSNVSGRLRPGLGALDAVRACFPGGTITGVPKLRAMEIIEELEPARRAFYTGSVGWLGFQGDADLNIVIRTILCKDGLAHAPVGAGVVADSDPGREWRETLHKARALLLAAGVEAP